MPFGPIKRFKNSISLRIASLFCLTFAIGLAIAYLVTYFELRYSLENSSREILAAKFQEAKALVLTEDVVGLKRFLSSEKNRILNAPYMVRVMLSSGETLFIKPSVQEKQFDFEKAFNEKIHPEEYIGWKSLPAIDDEDKFNMLTERISENLYLQVGTSSENREGILEQILLNFAIIEVILIFLSAFLGGWYARKSLAPLRDLLTTVRQIEKGNLSKRVPSPTTRDELQEIGDTFNRMISRIEKLIQTMRESLDNVAHDIRTPLTRIRIVAEDALVSKDPTLMRDALADASESASGISELVDQLLSISEAEAGTLTLHYNPTDIKILIEEVADIYEFPAQEKNIAINYSSIKPGQFISIDRKRIKQVVANLIDNAIKFSNSNNEISIQANIVLDEMRIDVSNQGHVISEEDKNRIWDRLYRADKSRSNKGLGLGLAIVRAITIAHGGRADVTSENDRTTFSIYLPINKTPSV